MKVWLSPGIIFWQAAAGSKILYNTANRRLYKMNDSMVAVLEKANGRHTMKELQHLFDGIGSVTEYLLNEGIVTTDETRIRRNRKISEVDVFYISLTRDCNLSCSFCLGNAAGIGDSPLNFHGWKEVIDGLERCQPAAKTIYLTGGEPTLHPDFLYVYKYIHAKKCTVNILTNGTLLHDRILDCLETYPPNAVLISIDGSTAEVNDAIRGEGTYKRIVQGTRLLRRRLQFTQIMWQTVVNTINLHDIEGILQLAVDCGVTAVRYSTMSQIGRGLNSSIELDVVQMANSWHAIAQLRKKYRERIRVNVPAKNSEHCQFDPIGFNGCGIGNILHITEKGYVTPCYGLTEDEFKQGPITRFNSLNELNWDDFFGFALEDYAQCSTCGLRYFCHGGCRAEIYSREKSTHGCNSRKKEAMVLYLNRLFLLSKEVSGERSFKQSTM